MILLSALRRPTLPQPAVWRGAGPLGRAAAVLCVLGCLAVLALSALAVADFNDAPARYTTFRARVTWVLETGNHLHFATHIVAGRVLDICPCTRAAADTEYWRARYHAVTPLEQRVGLRVMPRTPAEFVDYLAGPFEVGLAWLEDGLRWLGHLAGGP